MPITFTPISQKPNCEGCCWSIGDDDQLAELVARVALGQSRYVQRVLSETGFPAPNPKETALEGAIKLLTATDPKKPWHRDGWLFQIMSWIARHLQDPGGLIAPPHMIHAHKGFDGIHVKVDPTSERVTSVVICEEKATGNARKMVKDNIWDEFKEMQQGKRDNELVDIVTQLLEKSRGLDVDSALEEIIWKDARAYRVAITIGDEHNHADGYKMLFEGFNDVVSGEISKRRGEVLYIKDLRAWMASIAQKAIEKAKELDGVANV